jgi:hypothetical protein
MEENKKINYVKLLKVKLLKILVHLMKEYCQDLFYLHNIFMKSMKGKK